MAADRCEGLAAEVWVVANGIEGVASGHRGSQSARPAAPRARGQDVQIMCSPIPTSGGSVQTPGSHRSDRETLSGSQVHANRLMDESVAMTDRMECPLLGTATVHVSSTLLPTTATVPSQDRPRCPGKLRQVS
jgi:hypothetical protein